MGWAVRWGSVAFAITAGCAQPIELEWKRDLGAASVSTPLVSANFIAAGDEVGLVVVELDGRPRCTFDAHGEVISAPKTDGERIFFGSTNYTFFAVSPQCQEAWKFAAKDRIKSDPLVESGRVYISSYDGHLYALDAKSGALQWSFPPGAEPGPAGAEVQAPREPAPSPAANPAASSEGTVEAPPPTVATAVPEVGDFSYSSPLLHDGIIYVGNLDGRLYALDAAGGALRWSFPTDGPITSSPRVADGVLYIGSNDGYLYAIDLTTHQPRWKHRTQDWINSSACITDDSVYVGSNDRHVYALARQNGEVRWKFATAGPSIAVPAVYQNLVFAAGGSGDGAIYALQQQDGSLFWRFETGGKIQSDPVLVDDRLYITSTDQMLYAFRIVRTMAD